MKISFAFAIVITLFSIDSKSKENTTGPVLSEHQKSVVEYFKDVALGCEFGNTSRVTRKWSRNMKIFVGGSPNTTLIRELHSVIDELNALMTDNFQIEIVNDQKDSNFYMFFGTGSEYGKLYPIDARLANSNSGVYRIFWDNNNRIAKGHMFVNMINTSLEEQRHVLREELTQSLGLGRDSFLHPESLFYSNFTTVTQYAEIDKEIIRLLYHPKMVSGLSEKQIDAFLIDILLSKNDI